MKKGSVGAPARKTPNSAVKKQATGRGNHAQVPQIIRPNLPPVRHRRMIDSALGLRPSSSNASKSEITKPAEISQLPLHSVESLQGFEAELAQNPATSRSSAVLSVLPKLKTSKALQALDEILAATRNWTNESVVSLDFRVYYLLTEQLFLLIKEQADSDPYSLIMFRSLAICVKVMPSSDRVPLLVVLKLLYGISEHEEFDAEFGKAGILKPLIDIAFAELGDLSAVAAAILRHVSQYHDNGEALLQLDIIKMLCNSLRTDVRRERFRRGISSWVYQVIGLFSSLCDILPDYKEVCKFQLPRWLLGLAGIYVEDVGLQAAVSKALTQLMAHEECVEVIEDEDLTPFFAMIGSQVPKIVKYSALALANAANVSEMVTDSLASMEPPGGVYGLCSVLKSVDDLDVKVSIMRCLAKCSETEYGLSSIQPFLRQIVPLLDTPMNELDTWTPDQVLVANVVIVLKNLAIVNPVEVAGLVKGKMNQLMVYGIIDYVIDLMRKLLKCDEGKEVCKEVSDIEEVRLVLRDELPK